MVFYSDDIIIFYQIGGGGNDFDTFKTWILLPSSKNSKIAKTQINVNTQMINTLE